ncbi:hypothetical protein JCM19275_2138 [Nonlabens ulvanivorans]|uniref:Uncharacterized protein n=1 Tax=Nonlabens ulvanivorans TaxID=906888 RepID=A0A090WGD6_NONUL|nr:hypothetical protein JCM19275_2138 [Nonlabens ulvanivorans]
MKNFLKTALFTIASVLLFNATQAQVAPFEITLEPITIP